MRRLLAGIGLSPVTFFLAVSSIAAFLSWTGCLEKQVVSPEQAARKSENISVISVTTTWEVYDQADFREAVMSFSAGDTILLKKNSSELTFYMVNQPGGVNGKSPLDEITILGKSPRSTINMVDSVILGAGGGSWIVMDGTITKYVFFEFTNNPSGHSFLALYGSRDTEYINCGWTFSGDVGPNLLFVGNDGLFDSTDDIPDYAPFEGGLAIADNATVSTTDCAFEDASDECDFPVELQSGGELDVVDWLFGSQKFSFENHGPITNQNASVANDTAYVEFVLGASDDNEDIVDVFVRYKDDTDCNAGATQITAHLNGTTNKWNAKFYVGGFTDGDFYWRGKGKLCDEVVLGSCILKQFTGRGGSPPPWYED